MRGFWHWLKHEFHEVLPPTIFFLIAFQIVVFNRRLMLREYGLPLVSITSATVAALLIAKVVLITDTFAVINRFPEKPLMYNVVWKTVIYAVAALLIHYLEHIVLLFVYCALRELIRAIGREKVIEMFFGRRAVRSC